MYKKLNIRKKMKKQIINIIRQFEAKYLQRNERDFAYELYHQIRSLELPPNVEVTCDTIKRRFNYNDRIINDPLIRKYFFQDEVNENTRIHRYPDLLIHEYETTRNQLLAIEIKNNFSRTSLKRDIAKLAVYCCGKLKYQYGVLIILNRNRDNIIRIPDVKEMLIQFPKIEIWLVNENDFEVINSKSFNII